MRVFVAGVIAILCSISVSYAQDAEPSPTPTLTPSQRQQRLEEEARIKKLEAEIAGYEKAIRDSIPKPTSTPRSGTASLDGVTIEPQFVAFDAASSALKRVALDLKRNKTEVIVFYSATDLSDMAEYDVSMTQNEAKIKLLEDKFKQLKKRYCELVPCEGGKEIARYPTICVFDSVSVEPAALSRDWGRIRLGCRTLRLNDAASSLSRTSVQADAGRLLIEFSEALEKAVKNGDVTLTQSQKDLASSLKSSYDKKPDSREKLGLTAMAFPIGTMAGAAAAIGAAADILGYLKTDVELKGTNVDVGDKAMYSEIARHFNSEGILVLDPANAFPMGSANEMNEFPLYMQIKSLNAVSEDAGKHILNMEAEVVTALEILTIRKNALARKMQRYEKYIQELEVARGKETDPVKKAGLQKEVEQYDARVGSIDTEIDEIDLGMFQMKSIQNLVKKYRDLESEARAFLDDLSKSSNGITSTYSKLLGTYLLKKKIESANKNNAAGKGNYGWLNIDVVSAGGNNRTRRNFFQFFSGAKIDHSGGIIFHWTLYNKEGAIELSGIEKLYLGYKPSKSIRTQQQGSDRQSNTPVKLTCTEVKDKTDPSSDTRLLECEKKD